jgi:hypothetical protein
MVSSGKLCSSSRGVSAVRSAGCRSEQRKRPWLAAEAAGSARNSEGDKPVFAPCKFCACI